MPPSTRAVIPALLAASLWWLPVGGISLRAADEPAQAEANAPPTETSRIAAAANAFLGTLDETQRAKVLYRFDDKVQRARWSNFPTGFVPRGGIGLHEMNEGQRTAVMALLAKVLSPQGLEKVQQIMEADEVFKTTDHPRPPFGQDGG